MTLMGGIHNLSRSLGCALLAATESGKLLVLWFIGGEVALYLIYKIARNDYYTWILLDGAAAIIQSFINRALVMVIVAFSGCLHMRHPYELGGVAFR